MNIADIQASFDASPYIHSTGMKVTEANVDEESITVVMPLKPEFERSAGSNQFHGGPIAALIDTAGCYALIMILGHSVPTINFRTDYLRPAIKTSLRAVAKVRRAGRTVGVVDVDIYSDDNKLLAVGRGTFASNVG
jgi:uncharacterized protein (TIGR00369 family)